MLNELFVGFKVGWEWWRNCELKVNLLELKLGCEILGLLWLCDWVSYKVEYNGWIEIGIWIYCIELRWIID